MIEGANNMQLIGRHLIADMYGCRFEILTDTAFLQKAIEATAEQAKLSLVNIHCQEVEGQVPGFALTGFLTNGHIVIHTYPALGYAAIDVFTCDDQTAPTLAANALKAAFKPEKTKVTNIRRGDFNAVKDMKPKVKTHATPLRRVRDTGAKMLKFLSKTK